MYYQSEVLMTVNICFDVGFDWGSGKDSVKTTYVNDFYFISAFLSNRRRFLKIIIYQQMFKSKAATSRKYF
jgi:hypothetical protein